MPKAREGNRRENSSFDYSLLAEGLLETTRENAPSKLPAGLYVVSTPIGNLGDISLRALTTLDLADVVACEDTRVTGGLLHKYGIKKRLVSYHDHNAEERIPEILALLEKGCAIALTSDAGTPLVSDPGCKLVMKCRENGHLVTAVPGASALLSALAVAGMPTDRFLFAGFPPPKKIARQKALQEIAEIKATLVFYETSSRLGDVLNDMKYVFGGDRRACIARELTKMFEESNASTLDELCSKYSGEEPPKGEIVILVAPAEEKPANSADIEDLLKKSLKKQSLRDAVAEIAEMTGAKKGEVYKLALKLTKN